jgi:DNA-binding beta-propeller fold protein YncE
MIRILLLAFLLVMTARNRHNRASETTLTSAIEAVVNEADTTETTSLKPYSTLTFSGSKVVTTASGTKSVLFNPDGSNLYAINLEGMSIYEFDTYSKTLKRQFRFKPTKGSGWDYATHTKISSFEEKPVEGFFSNEGKVLWVSLHNAGGIVPIRMDSLHKTYRNGNYKKVTINKSDSISVPLYKTGSTPKVIATTADDKYLLVSNWHSNSISVLELDPSFPSKAKLLKQVKVSAIPRGIAIDNKNKRSYVAIMGSSSITVINNETWEKEKDIQVESNPRHVVLDSSGRLYVSYNNHSKVACIDPVTGKTLFSASTGAQPRTIILSKNQKFLFVTCYRGNTLDVFKIEDNAFKKIYSLESKGSPVGVDIFEDENKLEAWVCNYTAGNIKIFSFTKK